VHIDVLGEERAGLIQPGEVEGSYSVAESEKEHIVASIEQTVFGIVLLEEAEWVLVEEA
jgi:hypothetical protein